MKEKYSRISSTVTVVIPAYKVSRQIRELVQRIPVWISHIIIVDDKCPENSGELVRDFYQNDPRVKVLFNIENLGVGGATKIGYREALNLNSDIIIKLDGDGQMFPEDIAKLIEPLFNKEADYVKGNRFFDVSEITRMPKARIFGNLILSFFAKISTGYWMIFDPNNGFTAIDGNLLKRLPLDKIDDRYFFESDMLFRLNLAGAQVLDVSLPARYGTETSNLSVTKSIFEFSFKHNRNFIKRITYSYFLRDFTLASLELVFGLILMGFGSILAIKNYLESSMTQSATPTGTLVLVTMCILSGLQLLLSFFSYDIQVSSNNRKIQT